MRVRTNASKSFLMLRLAVNEFKGLDVDCGMFCPISPPANVSYEKHLRPYIAARGGYLGCRSTSQQCLYCE